MKEQVKELNNESDNEKVSMTKTGTPNLHLNPLVAELRSRQQELGLSDAEFARLLGISRPLWWMTRNGKRRINVMLLSGVAKAFPELDGQILDNLRSWSAA